jgi:putative lipoic acid-binding regulatory protein
MDENWVNSFRQKLDEHYAWPALYVYKFIVPTGKEDLIKEIFPFHPVTEKLSKQGNYTSVTIQMMMQSSDAVIDVYRKAAAVEGVVAL